MHHLRTLGSPAFESAFTNPLSSPRKQLSLLAYLARRPQPAASRAALASLLWEDREDAKARQSLRQALLELKGTLGDTLSLTDDRVAIADGALAIDATLFEQDVAAGRFADAVARWRGDFLEGFDDVGGGAFRSWLEAERESLRRQLGTAYSRLAGVGGESGSAVHAVAWAERWTRALPLDEGAQRRLIELLRRSGRAIDALARHRAFTARLRSDLDTEPSPAFAMLSAELEREVERAPGRRTPGSVAIFTPDHVGRAAALAELLAAWDAACAGHATGVVIEGENGIGKTRLGEELLRHLERQASAVVLRARATSAGEQFPLSAVRDLVRGLVDASGLSGASPATLAELVALSPALAHRFQKVGPAIGDHAAVGDALADAVMAVAEDRAVVLWCDDLSQVDVSSQRVILHATRQVSGRILYLAAARDEEESAPALAELHARPGVRRLRLQPLAPSEVDTLLGTMLEVEPTDRATLVRRLHNAAAGNPLHTIELITSLIDDGALELTEHGTWHLSVGARDELRLPATLQDAISRRLARLSPGTRAYAAAGAALGRTFDRTTVAAMADLSPAEAEAPLAELVARKLVRSASQPSNSLEFTHEVVWRVLHDSLTAEQRDALRRRGAAGAAAPGVPARRRSATPHRRSRGRRMMLAGGAALGAIALGLVTARAIPLRSSRPVEQSRDVVLAQPAPAGTSAFDSGATRALALAVERAIPGRMLPAAEMYAALARMRRADTTAVPDEETAREIAQRAGARMVLVPAVMSVGGRLVATYRLVDAATGKIMRARESTAGSPADAYAMISRLVRSLPGDLAAATPAPPGERLARVTTSSLEALRAYSVANRLLDNADPAARGVLEQAVALDSTFASAHALLAYLYWFYYDQPKAERHAAAAARWADDLPRDEKLNVSRNVANAREDWESAINYSRALVERDRRNGAAWHALAQLLFFDQRYSRALEAYDSAAMYVTPPQRATLGINRATVLLHVGRTNEAILEFRRAIAQDSSLLREEFVNHEYGAALVRVGQPEQARVVYQVRLDGTPVERATALRSLAMHEAHEGRFARAAQLLGDAVTGGAAAGDTLGASVAHLLLADAHIARGRRADALEHLAAVERDVRARSLPYEVVARTVKLLARLGAAARAEAMLVHLDSQMTAVSSRARARRLLARGEVLLAKGQVRDGRAALEQALALAPNDDIRESAAYAALATGAFKQGAVRYDSLGARRGIDLDGHALVELGSYWAARAWERAGRPDRAEAAYRSLLDAWPNGDPDLPAMIEARRRIGPWLSPP